MGKVVHCKKEKFDVYIGRPGIWGNPFSHLASNRTAAKFLVKDRDEAVDAYENWIRNNPELLTKLPLLEGKTLGCWCHPQRCHGDVLIKLLGELHGKTE